jgi:hypothetical protein
MYSDKKNVNILTALLAAYGIEHIAVCPGSRNVPLVHNFSECDSFQCHSITDERSAGFYALGMAQETGKPVAVCVTSGTALLNLAPAVAEAYYQRLPLIVISADRPQAWIGQQDGQTLVQPGVFGAFLRKSVNLYEPTDDVGYWHCNRLVNEALMALEHNVGGPVHINVQIDEPLFNFVSPSLPKERIITRITIDNSSDYQRFINNFVNSSRPMLVVGQDDEDCSPQLKALSESVVIISETISKGNGISHIDEAIAAMPEIDAYRPDMVIYIGGNIISKRFKRFLRHTKSSQWIINEIGEVCDTFMNLTGIVEACTEKVLDDIVERTRRSEHRNDRACRFASAWRELDAEVCMRIDKFRPEFSSMAAVKLFEAAIDRMEDACKVHYANSSAIRLANIFSHHFVRCNRGVNGIEGSLSTAAGMSLACREKVFCVIGDLSFFYDQNALWNNELKGNLRILLLNNGGGGIFRRLPGLAAASGTDFIMGSHKTSAEGICSQNAVGYRIAGNINELERGIEWLVASDSDRPLLLEANISAEEDNAAWKAYDKEISKR